MHGENLKFLGRVSKNTQMSNFTKILGVVCGQADRQTDRHGEANSRFLQICGHA